MSVKAIPEGYHSVTPYLYIRGAAAAIEFYQKAFGAVELLRLPGPGGVLMHAEIKIGDSPLMLADEMPDMACKSPQSLGGASSSVMLYVDDVDAMYKRALAAGAHELRAIQDQFWGDRMGSLTDPFGHQWSLATHVEDVPPEEIEQRFDAWKRQQKG